MPVFLPSVFSLYSCILILLIVGNRQKEAEEEKREGREKGLNFEVEIIGFSCLLIQKNKSSSIFHTGSV